MTNQQFVDYIKARRESIEAEMNDTKNGLSASAITLLKEQLDMLASAMKIMTYGTGPERRRFRRDYERNLARKGVILEG